MQEESAFLQKMQGLYAENDVKDRRMLGSLMFEYQAVLAEYPSLQREVQSALDGAANLDVQALVERLRPALQCASDLLVEWTTLDDGARSQPRLAELWRTIQARMTLATTAAMAKKFEGMLAGLADSEIKAEAPMPPALAEVPATPDPTADEAALQAADDLYLGRNGQAADVLQAMVRYHRLADQGSAAALNRLYWAYLAQARDAHSELDEVPLRKKALQYLFRAADANHPDSLADLASWYCAPSHEKLGTSQNFAQCRHLAQRAVDLGSRLGHLELGRLYKTVEFPDRDLYKAIDHLQRGAEAGDPAAWQELGDLYRNGFSDEAFIAGVAIDTPKAIDCYEKALGCKAGRFAPGFDLDCALVPMAHISEFGGFDKIPADRQRTLDLFARASERTKKAICNKIGGHYASSARYAPNLLDAALYWLNEGAQRHDVDCMRLAARMYFEEQHAAHDRAKGEVWAQKAWAAKKGDAHLCWTAGRAWREGPADLDHAISWFERGAEMLESNCACELANIFEYEDSRRDIGKALHWRKREFELDGDHLKGATCGSIGKLLRKDGPLQDLSGAIHWYRLAVQYGAQYSAQSGRLLREMGRIKEAVAEWTAAVNSYGDCFSWYYLIAELASSDSPCSDRAAAAGWLEKWLYHSPKDEFAHQYFLKSVLESRGLLLMQKALPICHAFLALPDASDHDQCVVAREFGMALLEEGPEQDCATAIGLLEKVALMTTTESYSKTYQRWAAETLSDIYREGVHGQRVDAAKAQRWKERAQVLSCGE